MINFIFNLLVAILALVGSCYLFIFFADYFNLEETQFTTAIRYFNNLIIDAIAYLRKVYK